MADIQAIPGDREVRATLDDGGGEHIVVACPPHPQHGGSRRDSRLRTIASTLGENDLDCLRVDYGPWNGGVGEQEDIRNAIGWAAERYGNVGLFGYSFGAGVALCVAANRDDISAISALAPPATSIETDDAATAVTHIHAPLQIVVGERDTTVNWEPVVEQARSSDATVENVPGDHFFVGQVDRIASLISDYFVKTLAE